MLAVRRVALAPKPDKAGLVVRELGQELSERVEGLGGLDALRIMTIGGRHFLPLSVEAPSDGIAYDGALRDAPGRARTSNLRRSKPVLCPIELQGRSVIGREARSCSGKRASRSVCRDRRHGAGFTSPGHQSARVSSEGHRATSTAQRRQRPARGALALGGHPVGSGCRSSEERSRTIGVAEGRAVVIGGQGQIERFFPC